MVASKPVAAGAAFGCELGGPSAALALDLFLAVPSSEAGSGLGIVDDICVFRRSATRIGQAAGDIYPDFLEFSPSEVLYCYYPTVL